MNSSFERNDSEWRAFLTPMQYSILREAATERPFSGPHLDEQRTGTYYCAGCGAELFVSDTKFDAGCGWPSFFATTNEHAVEEREDTSHGRTRTEIRCATCHGHLGHVFPDGSPPTGLRYCLNGHALTFELGI